MRKIILFSILTICLVLISEVKSFGQALSLQINALNQPDNKTIKLFNGQSLEGWYKFLQNRGRNNDPKLAVIITNDTADWHENRQ